MAVEQRTESERILAAREQFVPRGIATTPIVVARAEGARVEDVDGKTYVDFAGGLGCQNTGHGLPPPSRPCTSRSTRTSTSASWSGSTSRTWRSAAGSRSCRRARATNQKSLLLNTGAEAVENAVKIARAATGKPGVVVFENAFHGRTLLTMTMTHKESYKKGFGPFAPEVYRARGPYPYRGVTSDDALEDVSSLLAAARDRVRRPRARAGRGRVHPDARRLPRAAAGALPRARSLYVDDEVQSGVGRTGPVWAIEHYGVEPDLLVSGKSLGGGLPLAAVTGRAEVMDAPEAGGLGGTFGGNPVACAAAHRRARRGRARRLPRALRGAREPPARAPGRDRDPRRQRRRGARPRPDARPRARRPTARARSRLPSSPKRTTAGARERGLILLSCGLYGNVVRILVPLVIADDDLDRGLEILEESLVDAAAG